MRRGAHGSAGDRAEELLDETRHLLFALADGDAPIGLYDADARLRYANRAFRDTLLRDSRGLVTLADLIRQCRARRCRVSVDCDTEARLDKALRRRSRASATRSFEFDLVDGHCLWITETTLPDGWMLLVASDITRLKRNERAIQTARDKALRDSRTDALTGLPNRRHTLELAEAALARLRADDTRLTVACIDLDRFKQINDRFGHEAGDRVLRHFAVCCRRRLRRGDRLGRIGGEEFLLLLPGTHLAEARSILQRLLDQFPSTRIAGCAEPMRYTFSIGMTEVAATDGLEAVLRRADLALYVAKNGGRNRVEWLPP